MVAKGQTGSGAGICSGDAVGRRGELRDTGFHRAPMHEHRLCRSRTQRTDHACVRRRPEQGLWQLPAARLRQARVGRERDGREGADGRARRAARSRNGGGRARAGAWQGQGRSRASSRTRKRRMKSHARLSPLKTRRGRPSGRGSTWAHMATVETQQNEYKHD
jgi:hypothetical protein